MKKKATELKELLVNARTLRAEMEATKESGQDVPADVLTKYNDMIDRGLVLRKEIEDEQKLDGLTAFSEQPISGRLAKTGMPAYQRPLTWGEQIVASDAYKAAVKAGNESMPRVEVKDLHGLTSAAGGAWVINEMVEPVELARQPQGVLDLVNGGQTSSSAVDYVRQTTRTNNAAPTLEYDTTGGDFNLSPESNIVFELVTAAVRTIPTYIPASRNILADAPQLNALINSELTYMVRVKLEDQIVNGDGTGANFEGILAATGIQLRTQGSTGFRGGETTDTKADALRRAITDILLAFYTPDGILLNPGDGEDLELQKSSEGEYLNVFDPVAMRVWRVPVVESSVIAAGTSIIGNFKLGATLWDRQRTEIRVGEPGQMFLQSAVAILAELRAAFGVKRPTAFEKLTFA
jgi:HK97 family phage major capsid protein